MAEDTLIPWAAGSGLHTTPPKISFSGSAGWESKLMVSIANVNCKVAKVKYTGSTGSYEGHTEVVIIYQDGSSETVATRGGLFTNVYVEDVNPHQEKVVSKIEFRGGNNRTGGGSLTFTDATFDFFGSTLSFSVSFPSPLQSQEIVAYIDKGILNLNPAVQPSFKVRSGGNIFGPYACGQKAKLPASANVESIQVLFDGAFIEGTPPITKILLRRIR